MGWEFSSGKGNSIDSYGWIGDRNGMTKLGGRRSCGKKKGEGGFERQHEQIIQYFYIL